MIDGLLNNRAHLIMAYYLVINLFSFSIFAYDKYRAKKRKRRIREASLFLLIFLGGIVGSLSSMHLFKHKTKKISFYILPLLSLFLHFFILKWLLDF